MTYTRRINHTKVDVEIFDYVTHLDQQDGVWKY